jgi:hypothetical protein
MEDDMKATLLPIACTAALALAAPAAFAKGGDDGRGDDRGKDTPAQVSKGNDDPAGHDSGDDKGGHRGRHVQARKGGGTAGTCSGRSTSKLAANQPRNGRIQVEFEVESHVSGQVWTVKMGDNGATFFRGSKTTQAPGGSFEARAFAKNQAGTDVITASATNPATGETCTASLSV